MQGSPTIEAWKPYTRLRLGLRLRGAGGSGRLFTAPAERGPTKRTVSRFVKFVGTRSAASEKVARNSSLEQENPRYDGEMRIELITTGSELLLGQVLNSHPGYLSGRLAMMGLELARQTAVPDGREAILEVLGEAWRRSDLIIVTGGLGPTSDDITREVVAEFFQKPLEYHAAIHEKILGYFRHRNLTPPGMVKVQAMVPKGMEVLANDVGTAPGFWWEEKGKTLAVLPGPPRELRPMVEATVLPILRTLCPAEGRRVMRNWRVVGVPESVVEARVGEALLGLGIELGYCARLGEVDVRVLGSREQASQAESILSEAFGKSMLPVTAASLEQFLVQELTLRNQTVATAESCTGGFIANLLTNVPGSSAVFDSGRVTYANSEKIALGVAPQVIQQHGAVSEAVAESLARAARASAKATYGISTTGVAGPGGGTEEKPVGTVYVSVAGPGAEVVVEKHRFQTDRLAFKQLAAQAALLLLRRVLLGITAAGTP